ncbi:hypothetical protein L1887_22127 [Cichorium endivia]|nr:hypothetical protein L1887_22127 [Cichorium endivia]
MRETLFAWFTHKFNRGKGVMYYDSWKKKKWRLQATFYPTTINGREFKGSVAGFLASLAFVTLKVAGKGAPTSDCIPVKLEAHGRHSHGQYEHHGRHSSVGGVLYNKLVRFKLPRTTILNDEDITDAEGYLCILTGAIVVEFDTLMDVPFKDVNRNDLGVDLNSMVSADIANLDYANIDLRSGDQINSWVEYN